MFSETVSASTTLSVWKMIATPAAIDSRGLSRSYARPPTSIVPASGGYAPPRHLMSVDLPAPLWPSKAWTCPIGTVRSTPSSARTPPKDFVSPRIRRLASVMVVVMSAP